MVPLPSLRSSALSNSRSAIDSVVADNSLSGKLLVCLSACIEQVVHKMGELTQKSKVLDLSQSTLKNTELGPQGCVYFTLFPDRVSLSIAQAINLPHSQRLTLNSQ